MALRDLVARFRISFNRSSLRRADGQIDKSAVKIKNLGVRARKAQVDVKALTTAARGLGSGLTGLAGLGKAFAAAFAINIVQDFVANTLNAADAVGKTSKALRIGTKDLQAWEQVVKEGGGSSEDFVTSARTLAKNLEQATRSSSGPAAIAFQGLKIDIENVDGSIRSVTDILPELGTKLNGMTDESSRLAFAQNTLGRGALKLLPAFQGTREEFEKNFAAIRELAEVYDEDFIKQSEAVNDETSRLSLQFGKFRVQLIALLIPALRAIATTLTPVLNALAAATRQTKLMQAAMVLLGGRGLFALLRKLAPVIAKLGGFRRLVLLVIKSLLRFAIPLLIVEDLIQLFTGGRSIIGRFLNALLGVGKANKVVEAVKKAFGGLFGLVSSFFALIVADSGEATRQAAENFDAAAADIGQSFEFLALELGGVLVRLGQDLAFIWQQFAAWTKGIFAQLGQDLAFIWQQFVDWTRGIFTQLGSDIQFILGQALDWVADKFQALIGTVTGGISKAFGAIKSLFGGGDQVEIRGKVDGAALQQAARTLAPTGSGTSNVTTSSSNRTLTLNDNRTLSSTIQAGAGTSGADLARANSQARSNLQTLGRPNLANFNAVGF